MNKAVGYVRVSTEKQLDNTSIDKQIEEIEKYCQQHNLTLDEIYVEEAQSGASFKGRDKFKEMYHRIINPEENIKYLIVYKQDRISRDSLDTLFILRRLQSLDKHLISIADNINTEDTASKILSHILALVAELERDYILMRTGAGLEKRFERGYHNGGRIFGYRSINKEMQIVKEEAKVVKYIFHKYTIHGWGYRKIAHNLNIQGITTINNKPWTITAVKTILENKFYAGFVKWRGEYNKGVHNSIISTELWNQTRKAQSLRSYMPQKIHAGSFPLSGILKCPECHSSMVQGNAGKKYKYYQCNGNKSSGRTVCSSNLVNKETIEKNVLNKVFPYLSSLNLKPQILSSINSTLFEELYPTEQRITQIQEKLHEINKRKKNSLELFEEGIIDKEIIKSRFQELKKIEEEYRTIEKDLQVKLKQKNNTKLSDIVEWALKNIEKFYNILSEHEQKEFIHKIVKEITVNHGEKPKFRTLKSIVFHFKDIDNINNSSKISA